MPLLSVAEFRVHEPKLDSSVTDASLQPLLDAAESAITQAVGGLDATTEYLAGGRIALLLSRRIGSVTVVTEGSTVLIAADYRVRDYRLIRLPVGRVWAPNVEVTYIPFDDLDERKRVQLALVRLDLTVVPGLSNQSMAEASMTYIPDSTIERERIIAQLYPSVYAS